MAPGSFVRALRLFALLILAGFSAHAAGTGSGYAAREPIRPLIVELPEIAEPVPVIRGIGSAASSSAVTVYSPSEPAPAEPELASSAEVMPAPGIAPPFVDIPIAEIRAPEIVYFRATPEMVSAAEAGITDVLLEWEVVGVERAWINGHAVPPRGRSIVRPSASLSLTLSAMGSASSPAVSRGLFVEVGTRGEPACAITVRPERVIPGETVVVAWRAINAARVMLNGFEVPREGRESIRPTYSSVFDLFAQGPGGVAYSSAAVVVEDGGMRPGPGDGRTAAELFATRSTGAVKGLPSINFRSGDFGLTAADLEILGRIAASAKAESRRLIVVGHTDELGDAAVNLVLSRRRAEAARNVLITRFGLDASRVEAMGRGESEPIAPNGTPLGRELNRRVEFRFAD